MGLKEEVSGQADVADWSTHARRPPGPRALIVVDLLERRALVRGEGRVDRFGVEIRGSAVSTAASNVSSAAGL